MTMIDNDAKDGNDDPDDNDQPAPQPAPQPRRTLADVHRDAMEAIGNDDPDDPDGEAGGDEPDSSGAATDDDSQHGNDDDSNGDDPDDNKDKDAPGAASDDAPAPAATDDDSNTLGDEPEKPELDTDITKPSKYKAKFVDADDNVYYATSVKDLPDDFEPKSSKGYGMAIEDLQDKRQEFAADTKKYEGDKATYEKGKMAQNFKKQLADDEAELVKDGRLPTDATELQKARNAINNKIVDELNKGRVISFKDGYYRWQVEQNRDAAQEAKDKADKAQADAKKKRGGKVMGGGSGGANGNPNKGDSGSLVMEGKRPGTTLADVHASVMAGM
jgi:hypothetical protein